MQCEIERETEYMCTFLWKGQNDYEEQIISSELNLKNTTFA